MDLRSLVRDIAGALKAFDATNPVATGRSFLPGIGPLTEDEVVAGCFALLRNKQPCDYAHAAPKKYPSSAKSCDIVIPGEWALEFKLARPYGDNGRPAERWSENLLYPYEGNTSSISDCLKLLRSGFPERKAVVVIGYEHTPPKIALEPAVASFELIATSIIGVRLSAREAVAISGLVHPHHQQASVFAWEVLGRA